ncbi:MAG: glycosyltransferase family 2 protein [Proteobacteria bacterium]|nr:glycosyltransferase family 2 protein [Pseudomonadota bacterium]MBI3498741.1 glycosyltransferase family 2 protein [Pseudomonadota bacterium]
MADATPISVVTVTYNSARVIADCLAGIPRAIPVVLVDNDSGDETVAIARAIRPEMRILPLGDNRGFGAGANLGLAEVTTPMGLLLNPDARLRPGALDALAAAAARYPEAGLLAPCSWDGSGRLEFGRQPLFGAWSEAGGKEVIPDGDCCALYLAGSAMCFRLEAFAGVGGFDEAIFLYFEDDDVCLRLAHAGWSLVHVADAHVDHLAGRSSDGVAGLDYWKHWHQGWSRLHMEAKHHGRAAALALALPRLALFAMKAGTYRLLGAEAKHRRYGGRLGGTWGYLAGRQARSVRLGRS